jgi:hypothetical protein
MNILGISVGERIDQRRNHSLPANFKAPNADKIIACGVRSLARSDDTECSEINVVVKLTEPDIFVLIDIKTRVGGEVR